jgi:putative endonuclease
MFYVYIAQCCDGSLYTGWSTDAEKRVAKHNTGRGSKYTRSRLPVVLKYCEAFDTKHEAMSREAEIKKLSRHEKIRLIESKEHK